MSSNLTQDQPPAQDRAEPKLSGYGRVIVDTARTTGKKPRWHDGMTVEDGMIITGLPREEVLYHIHRILNSQTGNVSPDIYATLYLSEGASERRKLEPAKPAPQASAKIIQFPQLFGDYTRAVSNPLARCSLFAAVKERGHFKDWVLICDFDGVKIEAKGDQWNQDEADTLAQLVKMAMHKPFGADISVPVNAVLYGLGRHQHKSQRLQLYREIDRLVTSSLKITPRDGEPRLGHIIESARLPRDMEHLPRCNRSITYRLNKDFARFYDSALYTLYDQSKRLKLRGRGSELAKWLHFWIEGNAQQYPHKVATIREKCGSQLKDLKMFRFQLRQALDLLKRSEIITGWSIDPESDIVTIERTPSEAQAKHLTKKAAQTVTTKPAKKSRRRNKPAHVGEYL